MLTMDSALVSYFASGQPIHEETFLWIVGRNAATNAEEAFGFWTGDNTQTFTVFDPRLQATTTRNYTGSGTIQTVPVIFGSPTLAQMNSITFELASDIAAVRDAMFGKNLRRAHTEVHKGYYNPQTNALIANPMLVYIGLVDEGDEDVKGIPFGTGNNEGEPGIISVVVIPHIRGYKTNSKPRSHATAQARSGDTFYKWANVAGGWKLFWGKRHVSHNGRNKNKNKD